MKLKYFLFFCFSVYVLSTQYSTATVRYVSKTGSSTPPYTSWQTASDSIQKAVNIADIGDTIYVANGVYNESIYIDKTIKLIGSSIDSTVIDGRNTYSSINAIIYFFENNSFFKNFKVISPGYNRIGINTRNSKIHAENCWIDNVYLPLSFHGFLSSPNIEKFIITNFGNSAIWSSCGYTPCQDIYRDNVIISTGSSETPISIEFGSPTFTNNIVIEEEYQTVGIHVSASTIGHPIIIKNNLVSGYNWEGIKVTFQQSVADTSYIINNNVTHNSVHQVFSQGAVYTNNGSKLQIKNNIITNSYRGIGATGSNMVRGDHNLFWEVSNLTYGNSGLGDSNVIANPMFIKDTIPIANGNYDFHLQKYSPAIDVGDPSILDVDGSRSDIGMFGGPLGEKYTYQDLAPKPPRNLTASMDSGLVHLKWNKNTEADLFRYRVYRDTVPDFMYDTTKIIAVIPDTTFYDDPPQKFISGNYYYKVTAIDSAYNQSPASEEVHINITGIPEAPPIVVEHYNLLQNYPNPFNPSTTIPYRLKAPGYVKVIVYNLLGEQVKVLVNKYQSAGYYEIQFHPTITERQSAEGKIEFETGYGDIVSGIYLYRIEVIGEGNIPVFTDMKKMMLVK